MQASAIIEALTPGADVRSEKASYAEPYPNAYVAVVPNGPTCKISGLKHAQLYQLLLRGEASKHVRTVSLREPGAKRGKLLFHSGDMLRWLDQLAAAQAQQRGGRVA